MPFKTEGLSLGYLAILAIIQGITEFLPVSSSAHLAMFPELTGQADQGLLIDIAVHFGSLGAVILYNWQMLMRMGLSLISFGRFYGDHLTITIMALTATIPAIVVGYYISEYDIIDLYLRNLLVIGCATLFFGVILGLADRQTGHRNLKSITFFDAVVIGLVQPLAFIPGTSRSGICMTMARLSGLSRKASVQFAMILSIPVIIGASVKSGADIIWQDQMAVLDAAITAAGLAFITALISIAIMVWVIEKLGMMPFVIYRVILGIILIGLTFQFQQTVTV